MDFWQLVLLAFRERLTALPAIEAENPLENCHAKQAFFVDNRQKRHRGSLIP